MSKMTKNFAMLMLFVTTIILFSCAKDGADGLPGAPGSAGLNGVNGKDGAAGQIGATGQTGATGNANVKSSVFVANASDWIKTNYGGASTYYYRAIFLVPEITKNVLDKGLVMVYRSNSSTNANAYIALPYTDSYQIASTTYVSTFTPVHTEGAISIWKEDSDGLPIAPTAGYSFKVVVITPSGLASHPNVNYKNYAEVATAFGLE